MDAAQISSLVSDAYLRIQNHLQHTRIVRDDTHQLWLKCENEQTTGSFKFRGALSRLSLVPRGHTIVTASTGNHGLGVAKAASIFGLQVKIFLPHLASPVKMEKLSALGVNMHFVEGDSLETELAAKAYAMDHGYTWVSPYNDPEVIAGQGTIGLELSQSLQKIEKIYITVGGGGLISGIAGWLKHRFPNIEVIGCQPVNSPEMYLSTIAGHVVMAPDARPTLSDGSAGPLEEDSITFPICQSYIDRFMLIGEDEIENAIAYTYAQHHLKIEGAAGVAMAAAMKDSQRRPNETSVVVLCGGNIDPEIHRRICAL